jgi:glutathione S-transferase
MHLYSGPLSLFARKVEIALAEKRLAFTRTMVPFTQTEGYRPKHEAVLAANPKGQVPVLVDGQLTLYDSTVIIEYLDEAYPAPPLLPGDALSRARCRLLELEADEVLLPATRVLFFRTEPPGGDVAKRAALEEKAAAAEIQIARDHEALDAKLSQRSYLCGDFSVADIATFMVVHYGLRNGGPPFDRLARLSAWYRRLAERPSIAPVVKEIAEADAALSHPVARRAN